LIKLKKATFKEQQSVNMGRWMGLLLLLQKK
jgi:hypothetical protein